MDILISKAVHELIVVEMAPVVLLGGLHIMISWAVQEHIQTLVDINSHIVVGAMSYSITMVVGVMAVSITHQIVVTIKGLLGPGQVREDFGFVDFLSV